MLFWLAREARAVSGRAYAQTTRFELGEAITPHRLSKACVVVGFEEGFTDARYLKRTIEKKAPDVLVCSSLEETCESAVKLLSIQ